MGQTTTFRINGWTLRDVTSLFRILWSVSVDQPGSLSMKIGVLYVSHAMLVQAELILCSTRGFACILAKWFWPTVMSLSLTYGSSEASCNKKTDTYFGRRGASLTKEFWTLCILVMTVSEAVMVKTIPYSMSVLHIVCRFVKLLCDLDPTFCWPISFNGELFVCSVLKFTRIKAVTSVQYVGCV